MSKKVLLSFNEVFHRFGEEAWDLQHFSWKLHYGECVQVRCARNEQYEVLWRLLQRNLKPKQGVVEELRPVTYSSDESIASRVNRQESMNRALESKLFSEHLWADGKRMHVQNAMDKLQIHLSDRHKPLSRVAPIPYQRFLALLFMAAQVKLLLGRKMFESLDEVTLNFFQKWCPYFTGAVVIFGETFEGNPVIDTSIEIDAEGRGKVSS